MLQLLEKTSEIREAQKTLGITLKRVLSDRGICNIGYPSNNHDYRLFAAGPGELYWALSRPSDDHGVPRFVNSFGVYAATAPSQQIVVEISVPERGDDARAAGMFARDPLSGATYLLHSGKVGGGRKGVGALAFREFHGGPLEAVQARTRLRKAIRIGDITDQRLPALIWRHVKLVAEFKEEVRTGGERKHAPVREHDNLDDEVWGRRQGNRSASFDYYSYHGAIYASLKRHTRERVGEGPRVERTQQIDLGVWEGEDLVEVFEIKTGSGRQPFYTAVGQLMTHAPIPDTRKTLVISNDTSLPPDCIDALKRLEIRTQRFALDGEGLEIVVRWIET